MVVGRVEPLIAGCGAGFVFLFSRGVSLSLLLDNITFKRFIGT